MPFVKIGNIIINTSDLRSLESHNGEITIHYMVLLKVSFWTALALAIIFIIVKVV